MDSKTSKTVDIIAFSDFHGEIQAQNEYPIASAVYNSVKKIKDNNPAGTLVVGAGDLFDNPPMVKQLKGIPARKVLERFGMEVSVIGNHEFLWDMDIINNVTMKDSKFPFICANLFDKNTGKLVYQPYMIFNKGGVRIAVIGAGSPMLARVIQNRCPEKYYTIDGVTELNNYAAQIRAEKMADVIIALVHDGGRVIDGFHIGDIFDFAKDIKGVDALYAGHSHTVFATSMNGMHMLNADARCRGFIHTRISIADDGSQPKFESEFISAGDLESDPGLVELDDEIVKIIEQANKDTGYKYSEVVGCTDKTITKAQRVEPYGESDIGNWVCDVLREKMGADAALHSNKFLSDILKGKITPSGLFYVSKKCNVSTMSVKYEVLKEILENAFRDEDTENNLPKGDGIQVSGLKIKYDMNLPSMSRIVELTKEDGTPFDKDKTMLIALNGRMVSKTYFGSVDFNNLEFELKTLKLPVVDLLADNLRENGGTIKVVRNIRIENINGGVVSEDRIGSAEETGDDE